ncbi:MAG: CotH kinase family protein [Prevotella sp.]|nr:CotH kinase family protein [Prevotella sp.]
MRIFFTAVILSFIVSILSAQNRLTGTAISSTAQGTGYEAANAFDGDLMTCYASEDASFSWIGLALDTTYVIKKVGWAPVSGVDSCTMLGVFEGANREDFADAIPLFMITSTGIADTINTADVNVSRAFRYVRYVSPSEKYCQLAELEFYGEVGEGSDTQFYQITNLPLVSIHVDDGSFPVDKINNLSAHLAVFSKGGQKAKIDTGTVRLRGNSSRVFPKKPLRIKFANKTKLCGSEAKAKKWVLINSFDDKTLMRNNLAFEISRRIGMEYTPFCVPVDVMVNGEYQGTYELADQVEQHKSRVDVEDLEATTVSGDSLTGGYLIENDGNYYDEDYYFKTSKGNYYVIKYPDSDDINTAQNKYIQNHIQKLETAVYGRKFTDTGYRRYLDLESFVKYFLLEEFVGNPDSFWSTFFYKHRGDDRFYTGPGWDFNLAFDNDCRIFPVSREAVYDGSTYLGDTIATDWIYPSVIDGEKLCAGDMCTFVNIIVKEDSAALNDIRSVWTQLRASGLLDSSSIFSYIDEQTALLESSQAINYTRWNNLNKHWLYNPHVYGSWEAEIDIIKSYIKRRLEWMDWKLGCADTTMTVTISETEWSTLYLPMSFKIPEDMTVLSITGYQDGELMYDSVSNVAEANKPYLIKAPAGDYTLDGYLSLELDGQTNGLLTGTLEGTTAPAGSYVLQRQNDVLGFYKVETDNTINVGAKKAYLTLPSTASGAPALGFAMFEDGATGLKSMSSTSAKVNVYNLSGELQMTIDKGIAGATVESQILHQLGRGIYVVSDGNVTRKVVLTR